jgi:hypothetical protein
MVGFIETSYGIKPLNLSNIQSVSYFVNDETVTINGSGGTTPTSAAIISGTLVVEYIGNDVGLQSSGGNVVVGIPYYKNAEYPKKRFWDWVKEINGGSVNKTFNQFLRTNEPFIVSSYITTNYSSKVAYVVKVDDDASVETICETVFDTIVTPVEGLPGEKGVAQDVKSNTYINVGLQVIGSGQASSSTFPHIGRRVFISEEQGYMAINVFDGIEEKGATFNTSNSPALADGTYAWLSGTPGHTYIDLAAGQASEKGQSGLVYKVIIKGGRIVRTVACPVDFEAPNAVKDIPGKIQLLGNAGNNASCACYAQTYGDDGESDPDYNVVGCQFPGPFGFRNRPWSDAMFAFTNIPEADYETVVDPEMPPEKQIEINMDNLVCPNQDATNGGFFQQARANIPIGATAWIKDSKDEYVPFGASGASVKYMQQSDYGPQGDLTEIIVPMSQVYEEFVIDSTMVPPSGQDEVIPAFQTTTTKPDSNGNPISITCDWFNKTFESEDERFPNPTSFSMSISQAKQTQGSTVQLNDGCLGGAGAS